MKMHMSHSHIGAPSRAKCVGAAPRMISAMPVRTIRPVGPILRSPQLPVLAAVAAQKDMIEKQRNEEARRYFRSVYDFAAWQKHRSPYRYFSRLLLIPQSHILQNIVPSVMWVMLVAASVGVYTTARNEGFISESFPDISSNTACTTFISQTSVALSLLLVFRTNSSYARWDEVRKMWGGLLNRSRDLALQTSAYTPSENVVAKKAMERWIIAFAHVLRIHVQNEGTVQSLCGNLLTPAECEVLEKSSHRPMTALSMLTKIVGELPVGPAERIAMLGNITFFQDVLGGCERILRAPIPVSYTRHTARFLFVWLTTLPFALWPSCGWAAIPLTGVIAGVLGGIEEIGVQCEEPFGILPLEVIAGRITADVTYAINDTQVDQLVKDALYPSGSSFHGNGNGVSKVMTSGTFSPLAVSVGIEGDSMKVLISESKELLSASNRK
jgi:putative membrane protein